MILKSSNQQSWSGEHTLDQNLFQLGFLLFLNSFVLIVTDNFPNSQLLNAVNLFKTKHVLMATNYGKKYLNSIKINKTFNKNLLHNNKVEYFLNNDRTYQSKLQLVLILSFEIIHLNKFCLQNIIIKKLEEKKSQTNYLLIEIKLDNYKAKQID